MISTALFITFVNSEGYIVYLDGMEVEWMVNSPWHVFYNSRMICQMMSYLKAFQGDTRRCQHLPQFLFYKLGCKLPYMLVSQNLQVPFTSNFDQNFIISKGNDWYYFGLDYMTSEYFTDLSVKCIYFDLLKTPSLFDSFKMGVNQLLFLWGAFDPNLESIPSVDPEIQVFS